VAGHPDDVLDRQRSAVELDPGARAGDSHGASLTRRTTIRNKDAIDAILRARMRALDATDRKIVALLQENAKRTLADIGARVSLSVPAVKRRIDRLERDGVVRGYAALVDTSKLGDEIEVIVEVHVADRTAPGDIRASLEPVEEVVTAFTVAGEPDVLLRIRVENVEHLERVVEKLRRDPNIVRTRTLIVLSTIIDRAPV
jgi:Lrp/AsnC family leucine-responsive transcriptional regulator